VGALYSELAALDAEFHMPTYARKPVLFVRGEGMRLYDDDGREYLDFVSGIGAVNLGHAHPAVAEAVCAQMNKLVHVSNLYHVEHRARLAERLAGLADGDWRAFFCNSGAEATEGAIKLARRWAGRRGEAERTNVVTAERSFHGRTLAALAATGQPSKQEAFRPLPLGFVHVPLNDIEALRVAVDERTCAVMFEPIQGEGGVFPCDSEYLAEARALCTERGALLILDEVQTGFFRTGPAFSHQGYGVVPDVMTLAKSMANGLPIGALLATPEVASAFEPGDHGSTFAGGPVVCAAALATIDSLEAANLGANAIAMGELLQDGLRGIAEHFGGISDVRGRGLMVAAELIDPVAPKVVAALLASGVVVNSIGDRILRFLPPLVCTEEEIGILIHTLGAAMEVS
jgi:predicted acetylornithine/succinylornithine family transaminase